MTIHPEDQNDDLVEKLLKKTGCLELHYKLQVFVRNIYRVDP